VQINEEPIMLNTPAPKAFGSGQTFWSTHREASLNWLALGLLLAAWNASDNDAAEVRPRPESLRRYPYVSVRAAALHAEELRTASITHPQGRAALFFAKVTKW
jgi:hypothetical protein